MYVLPLQATSLMAYKRLLYAMMLVNAFGLYGRHGRLRFNTEVCASNDMFCLLCVISPLYLASVYAISFHVYMLGHIAGVLQDRSDGVFRGG